MIGGDADAWARGTGGVVLLRAFYSVLLEFAGLSPVITELVQDRVLLLLLEDLFALTNGVIVPF